MEIPRRAFSSDLRKGQGRKQSDSPKQPRFRCRRRRLLEDGRLVQLSRTHIHAIYGCSANGFGVSGFPIVEEGVEQLSWCVAESESERMSSAC